MIAPPNYGSVYDSFPPTGNNDALLGAQMAWDQIGLMINQGFWTGWNDLEEFKTNGDAIFTPGATI